MFCSDVIQMNLWNLLAFIWWKLVSDFWLSFAYYYVQTTKFAVFYEQFKMLVSEPTCIIFHLNLSLTVSSACCHIRLMGEKKGGKSFV